MISWSYLNPLLQYVCPRRYASDWRSNLRKSKQSFSENRAVRNVILRFPKLVFECVHFSLLEVALRALLTCFLAYTPQPPKKNKKLGSHDDECEGTLKLNIMLSVYMHSTAQHSTALHSTALHCTALHCTALHSTALHCTALHCTALHSTAQHCTAQRNAQRNATQHSTTKFSTMQ